MKLTRSILAARSKRPSLPVHRLVVLASIRSMLAKARKRRIPMIGGRRADKDR